MTIINILICSSLLGILLISLDYTINKNKEFITEYKSFIRDMFKYKLLKHNTVSYYNVIETDVKSSSMKAIVYIISIILMTLIYLNLKNILYITRLKI